MAIHKGKVQCQPRIDCFTAFAMTEVNSVKRGYIYIMTNKKHGTLYIGVTSNLVQRIYQHKNHLVDGFTKKYGLEQFVYYELYEDITTAIEREKQLKAGNRKKKIELIESINQNWKDLYSTIL